MRLKITAGARGRVVEVGGDEFVIGRDEDCDLVLDDGKVSRHHAAIRVLDGEGELRDLGSANGTFVDGERIDRPVMLRGGEQVRVGRTVLEVEAGPEGASRTVIESAPPPPATPQRRSVVQVSQSVIERIRLDKAVRRATLLGGVAVVAVLVVAGLAVAGVFSGGGSTGPSASEVIDAVRPSTVRVLTASDQATIGAGTGWAYDAAQGLIVTNAHVVAPPPGKGMFGGLHYLVVVDGERRPATLYADAPCYDLAMLKVDDTTGLETFELGSQSDIELGDRVFVLGYPGNSVTSFANTPLQATTGSVSVVSESQQAGSLASTGTDSRLYPDLLQTDAAINHGNSGGPLIDEEKRLVGVNTLSNGVAPQTTSGFENQGFAIGVDFVKEQAATMAQGHSVGFLGFDFIGTGQGLVVQSAIKGTAAEKAGFGTTPATVTAINGKAVQTRADYCKAVQSSQSGDEATVTVQTRIGGTQQVRLPFR